MSTRHSSTRGDPRVTRGRQIATNFPIEKTVHGWFVPSQTGSGRHHVTRNLESCTCPDFKKRQETCKHIHAVRFHLEGLEDNPDDVITVPTPKYSQNWPDYNAAQTIEKQAFQTLLHDLCRGIPNPPQERGRPRLPLGDMVFASAFKVYTGLSGRRFTTDLREAGERGYLSRVPHYNSIFNYLEKPELTPIIHALITRSSLPLKSVEVDFAVDSSGISTGRFVRWYSYKYGKETKRHDWLKLHIMTGVKTNIVTSVEVTDGNTHDSRPFPDLVTATAQSFAMSEVSADKAYSSSRNLEVVFDHGAMPFIPFKHNVSGDGDGVWHKMYHFYNLHRESFMERYHKRSNVEATFSMIKRKFGDRVRGKTSTAQVNEVLLKVLCHNICVVNRSMHELGVEPLFWAEITPTQKAS